MAIRPYFRFDDDNMIKYMYSHIIRWMWKVNTQSPIYCMKDNWENWLNLRHTRNKMYLTSVLEVQYLQIRLHNDANGVV